MFVAYGPIRMDLGCRIDMLVEESVVVERKAVEKFIPIHEYQALTCLRLSGYRLGLLINFNVPYLKRGIRRLVNKL